MKRYRTIPYIPIFMLVLSVSLSCIAAKAVDPDEMYQKAAALTKLSAAAESAARYGDIPDNIDDREFLNRATVHDKSLLEPFGNYKLRVLRQDKHAIILVCNREGNIGLLEDAGCTAELDKHLWQENPSRPCEFTLTVGEVCK